MSSIHGHEVIHLIQQHTYRDEASLLAAMHEHFGADTRYHTCSASDMSAQQLIEFLKARGKFAPADSGVLTIDPSKICNHD